MPFAKKNPKPLSPVNVRVEKVGDDSEFQRRLQQYAILYPMYQNTREKNLEALGVGVRRDPRLFKSIKTHSVSKHNFRLDYYQADKSTVFLWIYPFLKRVDPQ